MAHLTEEQMVFHYYADADDEAVLERHLAECASCHNSYQELKRVLALVACDPLPERSQEYGKQVWQRVRPHLKHRHRFTWRVLVPRPGWATTTWLAVSIVAAFLIGRFWPHQREVIVVQPTAAAVRERVLLASLSDHLERSQMLLTELAHLYAEGEVDISGEQSWVREIIEGNKILRQSAARSGEPGIAYVLEDLERILLEVEHKPPRITASELSQIQQRIESVGILFKVRVMGERLRQVQKADARDLARRSS